MEKMIPVSKFIEESKGIKLSFVDEDTESMVVATIPFMWTGHILVFNREKIAKALDREEAQRPGVYLLCGESEKRNLLYIGEGYDIRKCLIEQDKTKDWWSKAILITSSGEPLNKTHLRYLVEQLVLHAKKIDRVIMNNVNDNPSTYVMSEAATAQMTDFLEKIIYVLSSLGFNCS
ncbi:GIY-YIG nuclease family protein [Tolypothrix sp. VBCCA 56010]|uniref:GIY-YIG nuclease family protein n=1 Tax=Tolypothrix sp. VBCCA 56010 TaxID=3137731 RepID=UPI003D7CD26A